MAYQKQTWVDYPDLSSPITSERLNHMEDGIEEAWNHGGGGAGESLPVGSEIEYDGSESDIPDGWELANDKMKILWSNPNESSNFAAQNVELDFTGIDSISIIYKLSISTPNRYSTGILHLETGVTYDLPFSYPAGTSAWYGVRRVTIGENRVSFSVPETSLNESTTNRGIPLLIIGHNTGLFN